jgi:D-alanyl-D-alanine carboxypeptidase
MRILALSPWLVPAALVAMAPGTAQLPQLDTFLQRLAQEGTFYGSVLVTRGSRPVFRGDYGFQDANGTEPIGPAARFYAPWMTEPMLAVLVLKAQERGLLALDAPLGNYLPGFRDKPGLRLQDLLCHSSGLVSVQLDLSPKAGSGHTLAGVAEEMAWRALAEPPGKHFSFNHTNYDLVGLVLETVTGKSCPALLDQWILQPLGLARTGLGVFPGGQSAPWTYQLANYQKNLAAWRGGYHCANGLYTTVEDLDRFFQALTEGQLLSPASWEAMRAVRVPYPYEPGAGAGFGLNILAGNVLQMGNYDGTGFQSLAWCDPGAQVRIMLLGNRWTDLEGRLLRRVVVPEVYSALGLRP